ncbi:MAG: hypothetical protein R6X12_01855 [bacterium]
MDRIGRLRPSSRFFSSLVVLALASGTASAALCVWRSPDADIAELFSADGYKTVFVDISDARRARIEARLGFELDPDETQFKFFPVFRADKQVGTVMTHAGKGQFGAIEVVVAVVNTDSGPRIRAVRIQRDRERAKAALRSREFLGQFAGKGPGDAFAVGKDIKTAAAGAEKASQAVAAAARKLVVVYDDFYGRAGGDQ